MVLELIALIMLLLVVVQCCLQYIIILYWQRQRLVQINRYKGIHCYNNLLNILFYAYVQRVEIYWFNLFL